MAAEDEYYGQPQQKHQGQIKFENGRRIRNFFANHHKKEIQEEDWL
jgi:hypothetical protein